VHSLIPLVPVTAVVELAFDPIVTVAGWHVRIETIALALVVLAALVLAALIARRTPVDLGRPADHRWPDDGTLNHLRADDLLYIALAALPGAIVGGRLGYVLAHLDYYGANTQAILDPGQGGLELALAIVGGVLTAGIIAWLLGAPIGRWMHALVLPLLFAVAAGKVAMLLGGDGQGPPLDASWAVAYLGPGPWGSLAPAIPSHAAQAYEAVATTGVLLLVLVLDAGGVFARRTGAALVIGIGLWAAARALVATTWRDPAVLGPLSAGQLISIGIALGAGITLVAAGVLRMARRRGRGPGEASRPGSGLEWPDPASRPRF
jgi:phosphatidylglycerol:prolipoprotein diacylglycerol transferase